MKVSKRILLLSAAPIIALGIGGAVFALKPDTPKGVAVNNTSAITQPVVNEESVDTAETQPAQQQITPTTQGVETPPPVSAPTPEENKVKVMQKITDYATSKGWGQNDIYAETTCFDRVISSYLGYSNYDDLFNPDKFTMLQAYLSGKFMFDGTTCKQMWLE